MFLCVGHALSWDEIIYDGDVEEKTFSAFFIKSVSPPSPPPFTLSPFPYVMCCRDDKVLAVCSLNSDPVVSKSAELMYQGKMPLGSQLK